MDIEELVKKHAGDWSEFVQLDVEARLRAALTELARGYEERIRDYTGGDAELLRERIRQLEAERVPDGWQPVPIEPTQEMLNASGTYDDDARIYWNKFLSAAPQPKKEGE